MVAVNMKGLINRLDKVCKRSMETAAGVCVSRTNYEVSMEHLLLVLAEHPMADIQMILRHFEIEPARFQALLQAAVEGLKTGNAGKPVFSPLLLEWIQEAWLLSSLDYNLSRIRSGVLLAALVRNPRRYSVEGFTELLENVSADELQRRLLSIVDGSEEDPEAGEGEKEGPAAAPGPRDDTALGRFTLDFTARARAGEIDPVFGRDVEIRQMIDVLARRRKNNPIVVGEAGVGKTALIEGLALRVVEGDVPDILKDVDILVLDLGLLQAGAGVKGEFENRLKSVITEVKESPRPIILFIDEAHVLIGAGGAAGGSDAANLLKPALARGELRTIAATTWSEYKKYFEKDAALARRFQLVKLDEPSEENAVLMLRGLREMYEASHKVMIRDEAVEAAVRLSSRYISGRQLPDKAVDLIDTCAARVKIDLSSKPASLDDAARRVENLEREKDALIRDRDSGGAVDEVRMEEMETAIGEARAVQEEIRQRWEREQEAVARVLDLRRRVEAVRSGADGGQATESDEEPEPRENGGREEDASTEAAEPSAPESMDDLKRELDRALEELESIQGKDPLIPLEVGPESIARVVADWTGIPIGKMVQDEARSILQLEERLGERIKGQGHAIDVVAQGIRASKAGLANPKAPIGVFLFVGPSGVGKTESALAVAELLFGGERFMATINMSEFQEKHTVSRLIGSPPGYVGFGEGGVLTEAVRQRPYSVVLLDEVEKADPEVMNLFYQVFDKGMLADGEGRIIDFKNTVIFLTSNLASDIITSMCGGDGPPQTKDITDAIRPVLSNHFKPALLARMNIVPFFNIDREAMKMIVGLKIGQLAERLRASHRMRLDYDPLVVEQIAQRCTEVETGARNIDHIMQGTLLPRISTEILQKMTEGELPDTLSLGISEEGEFTFAFSSKEG